MILLRLIAWTTGNSFLLISVTFWDAQNRPDKWNSYAKGFPIDDIHIPNYLSIMTTLAWLHNLELGTWRWMLQRGSRGLCNQSNLNYGSPDCAVNNFFFKCNRIFLFENAKIKCFCIRWLNLFCRSWICRP